MTENRKPGRREIRANTKAILQQHKDAIKAKQEAEREAYEEARRKDIETLKAQENAYKQERLKHATGCPRCGSIRLNQKKKTSGMGWGLFFGGLFLLILSIFIGLFSVVILGGLIGIVIAAFSFILSLVLCIIAIFLNERIAICNDCGWTWKVG